MKNLTLEDYKKLCELYNRTLSPKTASIMISRLLHRVSITYWRAK